MSPFITIIVTAYNIERYIIEALNSCIQQDYINYEIICIDDGSTDNTYENIKNYIHCIKTTKITVYKKNNGGPNSARREGIKHANGDYIFFMDGDDILPINALSSLANELNDHLYDIVFGSFQIITDKSDIIKTFNYNIKKGCSGIKALETYIYNPKAIWGKLIKRSLFTNNDINYLFELKIGEDAALMTQLLFYSKDISECKNITYIYRAQRVNSLYTQYGHDSNYEYIIPSYLYISNFLSNRNLINNPIYFNFFHNIIYRYLTDKRKANNNDKDIQTIINNLPFEIIPHKDKIAKLLYPLSKINIKYGRAFLKLSEKWFTFKNIIISK